MKRWFVGTLSLGPVVFFLASATQAAPLGDAIADQSGSKMLVNAGNAIQGTCAPLAAKLAQRALVGAERDLYNRCNEMLGTYGLPASTKRNTYGWAVGSAGNSDRSNDIRHAGLSNGNFNGLTSPSTGGNVDGNGYTASGYATLMPLCIS